MSLSTQFILNPAALGHRTGRMWQVCQRECLRELAPAEVVLVESAEEALEATRISALKGHQRIVSVGGRETIHGVVNGLMSLVEEHRREMKLGLLSVVRPDEWSRTIDFPRQFARQLEVIKAGHTMPFDVGHVDYHSSGGQPLSRYFLNGVAFGLSGQIRQELTEKSQPIPETIQALARTLSEFLLNRGPRVRMERDGGVIFEGPCTLALIMAGQYYPTLGEITPQADPVDGALDVVWITSPKWFDRVFGMLRILSPIPHARDQLSSVRTSSLRAVSLEGPVFLEADGLFLGKLPATITTIPRALPVIVPFVGERLRKVRFETVREVGKGHLAGYSSQWEEMERQRVGDHSSR